MDEPETPTQEPQALTTSSPVLVGEVVPWEPRVGDRVRLIAEERVSYGRVTGTIDWLSGEVEMSTQGVLAATLPAGTTATVAGIRDLRTHGETPEAPHVPATVQRFYQLALDHRPPFIPATQPLLFRKENLERLETAGVTRLTSR